MFRKLAVQTLRGARFSSSAAAASSASSIPAAMPVDWSFINLGFTSDEDKADHLKIKAKWEETETFIASELAEPVPVINWAEWERTLRDSKPAVEAFKKMVSEFNLEAQSKSKIDAAKWDESKQVVNTLISELEAVAAADVARLAAVKTQRESLLWEKYNIDAIPLDVMLARYPSLAAEVHQEIDDEEWFVDAVADCPKGWGVFVLDAAGKPTPRPAGHFDLREAHH